MAFSLDKRFWVSSSLLLLFALSVSSLTPHFSFCDSVFNSQGYTGRSLRQAKKDCPVNFEFLNYTIITSNCKGPQYPPKQCCEAFKKFACPYAKVLNDPTNDCATIMFSYINLYGKYPLGLFSNVCREGKNIVVCSKSPPSVSAQNSGIISHH